jgi:tRNA 2-thiouridine synthesizing protein B
MSTLHLVNKSPARADALAACLRAAAEGDAVLLIEDGAYAATAALLPTLPPGIRCCVLEPDARARGVHERLAAGIDVVDPAGFVRLTVDHARVTTWL